MSEIAAVIQEIDRHIQTIDILLVAPPSREERQRLLGTKAQLLATRQKWVNRQQAESKPGRGRRYG